MSEKHLNNEYMHQKKNDDTGKLKIPTEQELAKEIGFTLRLDERDIKDPHEIATAEKNTDIFDTVHQLRRDEFSGGAEQLFENTENTFSGGALNEKLFSKHEKQTIIELGGKIDQPYDRSVLIPFFLNIEIDKRIPRKMRSVFSYYLQQENIHEERKSFLTKKITMLRSEDFRTEQQINIPNEVMQIITDCLNNKCSQQLFEQTLNVLTKTYSLYSREYQSDIYKRNREIRLLLRVLPWQSLQQNELNQREEEMTTPNNLAVIQTAVSDAFATSTERKNNILLQQHTQRLLFSTMSVISLSTEVIYLESSLLRFQLKNLFVSLPDTIGYDILRKIVTETPAVFDFPDLPETVAFMESKERIKNIFEEYESVFYSLTTSKRKRKHETHYQISEYVSFFQSIISNCKEGYSLEASIFITAHRNSVGNNGSLLRNQSKPGLDRYYQIGNSVYKEMCEGIDIVHVNGISPFTSESVRRPTIRGLEKELLSSLHLIIERCKLFIDNGVWQYIETFLNYIQEKNQVNEFAKTKTPQEQVDSIRNCFVDRNIDIDIDTIQTEDGRQYKLIQKHFLVYLVQEGKNSIGLEDRFMFPVMKNQYLTQKGKNTFFDRACDLSQRNTAQRIIGYGNNMVFTGDFVTPRNWLTDNFCGEKLNLFKKNFSITDGYIHKKHIPKALLSSFKAQNNKEEYASNENNTFIPLHNIYGRSFASYLADDTTLTQDLCSQYLSLLGEYHCLQTREDYARNDRTVVQTPIQRAYSQGNFEVAEAMIIYSKKIGSEISFLDTVITKKDNQETKRERSLLQIILEDNRGKNIEGKFLKSLERALSPYQNISRINKEVNKEYIKEYFFQNFMDNKNGHDLLAEYGYIDTAEKILINYSTLSKEDIETFMRYVEIGLKLNKS